jgi:hypothetical protein
LCISLDYICMYTLHYSTEKKTVLRYEKCT